MPIIHIGPNFKHIKQIKWIKTDNLFQLLKTFDKFKETVVWKKKAVWWNRTETGNWTKGREQNRITQPNFNP